MMTNDEILKWYECKTIDNQPTMMQVMTCFAQEIAKLKKQVDELQCDK